MKAQELRIGNLLEFSNGIQPTKIVTVGRRFFSSAAIEKEDGDFGITPYYRGIPLTEEWLLRFGFVSNPYQDRYENQSIHIECNKTRGVTELWIESMPHIKYVHQIQNLYFALTGEELIHDEWVVTKDNHPSIVNILKD
jgi:hypothetical protein